MTARRYSPGLLGHIGRKTIGKHKMAARAQRSRRRGRKGLPMSFRGS